MIRLNTLIAFLLSTLLIVSVMLIGGVAYARDGASVGVIKSVSTSRADNAVYLSADFNVNLSQQLQDAALRGVPFNFTVDVEVTQPRWYWFDEKLLTVSRTWRVTYNLLTNQWRVGSGPLALPVSSLDEVVSVLERVRGWQIADAQRLPAGVNYKARMRIRLDTLQLSHLSQVGAGNELGFSSSWRDFIISDAKR